MENGHSKQTSKPVRHPGWIEVVQQHVAAVDYGAVQIIIHGSRVVQIERTERLRFDSLSGAFLPDVPQIDGNDQKR